MFSDLVKFALIGLALLLGPGLHSSVCAQQNSTKKIRIKPSVQAKRIGTAINWESNFASAAAKSKKTGKPIFWYVPTVSGSFMDRKNEIDRYMMAGPFSWRPTVSYINENFVPVKAIPSRKQQEKYGLLPFDFVEPGFVSLRPNLEVEMRVDKITTMHPQWFLEVLSSADLKQDSNAQKAFENSHWSQFQSGNYEEILASDDGNAELMLFKGMALFRQGKHEKAKAIWREASKKFPEDPLAWKAAAEAEGIGPFYRGFEVYTSLTNDYSQSRGEGTAAVPKAFEEEQLWKRGVEFLLGMQNEFGGFVDSDYDFGGTDSLPNVHTAVTSLAGMALIRSLDRKLDPETRKRVLVGILNAIEYVSNEKNIAKFDRDEILWAYAYRLRFLVRAKPWLEEIAKVTPVVFDTVEADIGVAVEALQGVQSKRGSWYHEYSNPFVTATALAALKEAGQAGFPVDAPRIEKGVASLANERMGNGAYPYSSGRGAKGQPGNDRNIAAAAGRMPLCEMGLWYWGKSSDEALVAAIEKSIALQENLNVALKYDDHTSHLAYGGFFFWYDMRARSEAISLLKDGDVKSRFQAEQKKIILGLPEIDGCFVDSHELGRVYGTAMALLSLANCE